MTKVKSNQITLDNLETLLKVALERESPLFQNRKN